MGLIHLYIGDGKGKTSAAIGQGIRAAGNNMKVLIARFLKNNHSGELQILRDISNIALVPNDKDFGFIFNLNEDQKLQAKTYYTNMFNNAAVIASAGLFDMLILDEIIDACNAGMVELDRLIDFLKMKPDNLEVLLTGRNPHSSILDLADYVSDIRNIKHPFDNGVAARKGIEY